MASAGRGLLSGTRRCVSLMVLVALVAACGGGGGGGGGGNGGAADVPQDPPAAPGPAYSGLRAAADLADRNVGALADSIWGITSLALQVGDDAIGFPDYTDVVFDETLRGDVRGTVRVRARFRQDGTGFIILDFSGYSDGDATYNGRQVFEKLVVNGNGLATHRIGLDEFEIESAGVGRFIYSGQLTRTATSIFRAANVTGSISVREPASGLSAMAEGLVISAGDVTLDGRTLEVTGRFYDGRYGYVDCDTQSAWQTVADAPLPVSGGPLTARGAGGRLMRLSLINRGEFALEYAAEGDPEPAHSARVVDDGDIDFETKTTHAPLSSPVADAGASLSVRPGTVVTLDARYSRHPETAFLTYEWRLLFRPPGSTAGLSSPIASQPEVTLDVPGSYVFRMTASDGTRSDTDFVVLTADSTVTVVGPPPRLGQLTPDEFMPNPAQVNIVTDIGPPRRPQESLVYRQLVIRSPSGFPQSTTETSPGVMTFDATDPGIYDIQLYIQGCESCAGLVDFKRIAVAVPLAFLKPAARFHIGEDNQSVSAADLDGDGRMDLVVTDVDRAAMSQPRRIRILHADGQGSFVEQAVLGVGRAGHSVIGDVNGDGRKDILVTGGLNLAQLDVFLQQPDGGFTRQALDAGCFDDDRRRPMFIEDINGDGRFDIVGRGGCSNGVIYYLQQSDGTMGPPVSMPVGTTGSASVAVGDLTGDGVNDVVAGTWAGGGQPTVMLFRGQPGAGLAQGELLPEPLGTGREPVLAVADLDGDGRDDLVAGLEGIGGSATKLHVFHQNPGGGLARTQVLDAVSPLYAMWIHDFDADGHPDIGTPGLRVNFQDVNGTFGPTILEGSVEPDAIADVDGDGFADLVQARSMQTRGYVDIALARPPKVP